MSENAKRAEDEAATRRIAFAGMSIVLDCSGALFVEDERALVLADMHLEKASRFAARGMLLPPYDTAATLAGLARLVAYHRPRIIISLGDGFDDAQGGERLAVHHRDALAALAAGRDFVWIAGNHDPAPPSVAMGSAMTELRLGSLLLRHEPDRRAGLPQIAGHLHPAAKVATRGKIVRRRAFACDGSMLILPAFGPYSGGINMLGPAFRHVLTDRPLTAYCLTERRIHAFDSRILVAD